MCGGCDGSCVFCLYCETWSCRCSCMGSVSHADVVCVCFVASYYFSRHRRTGDLMMVENDKKATLLAIHTSSVNQAVNRQEVNVVLDDRPPLINNSEKDLTRKERTTLAQLRSGHCRLLGSYKSRINKDATSTSAPTVEKDTT